MDLPFPLPTLLALSPALVAIAVALLSQRVLPALFAGVVVGAAVAHLEEIAVGHVIGAFESLGAFLADAAVPGASSLRLDLEGDGPLFFGWLQGDLASLSVDHLIITAFAVCIAAMVGVLGRSGATRALVRSVEGLARGPRGAQVAAWLAGLVVFFDDYANCLVVGSAMGPVFDRFRVSRAKLAFIVDCTAAPIASVALVSTWVGYEVGLIASELDKLGADLSPLGLFVEALPYAFYAASALALVGAVAVFGRDFGPMLDAERAARAAFPFVDEEPPSPGWYALVAALPIVALVGGALGLLYLDGSGKVADASTASFFDILAAADPFRSLLWATLGALALAVVLAVATGGLAIRRVPAALWAGVKPVVPAVGVLLLAWGLGNAMEATRAADELTALARPSPTFTHRGGTAEIPITLTAEAARVRVAVVDAAGVTVASGRVDPGVGERIFRWDGSTAAGVVAPPGPYTIRVRATDADGGAVDAIVHARERFPPFLLPAVVFVVAAATALATGTSFGTMAILVPLVVPLGFALTGGAPEPVLLASVAAVLSGAILGDHASPISDTTVLSALGAGVDLVTHVRTQLPYALSAGVIALVGGFVPAGLGISPWISLAVCVGATVLLVRVVGQKVEVPKTTLLVEGLDDRAGGEPG